MSQPHTVVLHLEQPLRKSAEAGTHNFISKMVKVLENARFRVEFSSGMNSKTGYSLSHMSSPPGQVGLVFRRVYHYPFWQIDQSAARWDWDTAKATFNAASIDALTAQKFYRYWQKRLWGDFTDNATRAGFVYVPLQGRLLEHRSFQSCSPLEMLEICLQHVPNKKVIAGLHPKEIYSKPEIAALEGLAARYPRLQIQKGGTDNLLQGCDAVVTQNSAAAFNGYFFAKPAILFAKIDFHHIATIADVARPGAAFAKLAAHKPDYAAYIYWFWQLQSINAGRDDAEDKIARRLLRFGWPLG